MGASAVYAVDISDVRLDLARKMGATDVFNPTAADDVGAATANWLIGANGGFGLDVVLEMSGAPSAVAAAFDAVRTGGRVTLFGIPAAPITIDFARKMIFKNLTILAVNGRRIFDTWYKTRWLLENRIVDLEPLVTHVIELEQVNDVLPLMAEGKACKIVIDVGGVID
jgi:threonine 3-dehydrogenase